MRIYAKFMDSLFELKRTNLEPIANGIVLIIIESVWTRHSNVPIHFVKSLVEWFD